MQWQSRALIGALFVSLTAATSAATITYDVTVNTASLAGTTGSLDFNFNPGPSTTQAASLQIQDFSGATLSGSAALTGAASGALPGVVTIGNSGAFNDYFQDVAYGTSLQFDLSFSGPALSSPDGISTSGSTFAFSMFSDQAGTTPALTSDVADGFASTIDVNLDGSTTVQNYSAETAVTAQSTSVPEPTGLCLVATGLLALFGARRLRRLQPGHPALS